MLRRIVSVSFDANNPEIRRFGNRSHHDDSQILFHNCA
jgi:hypothetical protein